MRYVSRTKDEKTANAILSESGNIEDWEVKG